MRTEAAVVRVATARLVSHAGGVTLPVAHRSAFVKFGKFGKASGAALRRRNGPKRRPSEWSPRGSGHMRVA